MSTETIAEIAEREAAEAEEDEAPVLEPDEDEDDSNADPPSAGQTIAEIEAELAAIETKAANYRKGIRRLLDATGAPWHECPMCVVSGYVLPADPTDPDDQERKQACDAYWQDAEPPFPEADDRARCEPCDGWGMVQSGARNELNRLVPCSHCMGLGWIVKGGTATVAPPPGGPLTAAVAANAPGFIPTAPDAWDRPPGHPHYGIPPSMVGA